MFVLLTVVISFYQLVDFAFAFESTVFVHINLKQFQETCSVRNMTEMMRYVDAQQH